MIGKKLNANTLQIWKKREETVLRWSDLQGILGNEHAKYRAVQQCELPSAEQKETTKRLVAMRSQEPLQKETGQLGAKDGRKEIQISSTYA